LANKLSSVPWARATVLRLPGEHDAFQEVLAAAWACDASLVLAAERTERMLDDLARAGS
jgi:hypothetical protein